MRYARGCGCRSNSLTVRIDGIWTWLLGRRVPNHPHEQDCPRQILSQCKEERAVNVDALRPASAGEANPHLGHCCCLSTLFVHVHVGLVLHLRDAELRGLVDAGKVRGQRLATESDTHAERAKRRNQAEIVRQLELRQLQLRLPIAQVPCPVIPLLRGQGHDEMIHTAAVGMALTAERSE